MSKIEETSQKQDKTLYVCIIFFFSIDSFKSVEAQKSVNLQYITRFAWTMGNTNCRPSV